MLPNCNWLVRHIGLEGIHPHMQEEERKFKTLVFGLWSWLKTWTDSTSICQHWSSSITHPVLTLLWSFCKSPDILRKRWTGWSGPLTTCGWAVQVLKSDRESRKAATSAPLLWIPLSAVSVSLPHTQVSISKINSHLRCLLSLATCYSPPIRDTRQDYFKQIWWKAEKATKLARKPKFQAI